MGNANPYRVSVVIPVLNEERDIRRVLDEILAQESPQGGFEVIVVDGGSNDRTREIVGEFCDSWPNLRLVDNPRRLSSAGRNVGAREATGQYVMFLDGHCSVPRRDYLVTLVSTFESTGAACLCRPQPLRSVDRQPWAEAIAAARHSRWGHNAGSDIYNDQPGFTNPESAGAAYERQRIAQLGGYDERFDACEDVEFNHRVRMAGLTAYHHPDLAIHYEPRNSLPKLFQQMRRYGRGRARLMARHPRVVPWPLVALTLLLVVAVAAAAGGYGGTVVLTLGLAAAVATVSFAVEGLRIAGFNAQAVRIALALGAIYSGLVVGFWRGLAEFWRFRKPKADTYGLPIGSRT